MTRRYTYTESQKEKKKKRKHRQEEASLLAVAEESSTVKTEKKIKKSKVSGQPSQEAAASLLSVASPPSKAEVDAFLAENSVSIHGTTPLTPILSFGQLDVPEELRAACNAFTKPTPIQACSWPAALAGQDVVGIAETGR